MPKKGGGAEEALSSREQENAVPLSSSSQIGHFIKWKRAKGHAALLHEAGHLLLGLVSLATVTGLYFWLDVPLVAAAFTYLAVLVLLALISNFSSLIVLSLTGVCCLSYFFAPPIYSFRVDYSQDLITISAFVITSFIVNFLVTRARVENVERKRAEQALRESEYKLRQIFETVPSHLWSANPAFEPTSLNQHLLDYFGRGFEEFKHGGWEAFLHPDDLPETAKAISHAVETGTYFQVVHRLRRADGEFRWHHARGEPLRDRQGNIIQWYGLSVDIDEAKKAEDRLRRSGAYLAEAQRLSHTGSFGWTPSTGELHWSDETFRILEYDPSIKPTVEQVLQRIHPDERAMIRRLIEETSGGEKDLDLNHRLLMPNGSVKFVHVLSHAMKDAAGNLEIVGALMDVTENTFLYRDLAEREARLVERTKALRSSEGYLAEAQRLSHTGTWVLNPTTMQYFYWSDESYRIWAFDPLQGFPSRDAVWQRIHPDDRDRVWEKVQEALRQKKDYLGEFRIVLPDGTVKYLAATSHHLFSTNGEIVEVIGTNVDVTERKCAEEALRESEAKFRDYAETASDWFWEIGPGYKFTLLTENAFGSNSADRIGTACWDHALDLETEPEKWGLLRATLDSRKPFRDFVYCALGGDGSPIHVRASGRPMFDANGEFRGYRGTGTDVTAIMRAQEALRESERRSRSAFDGIAGLVAVMTPNGELETVNRQCLEYFGRSLEEQKNWEITDMVHPEDLPHMLELFKRAIASEIPYHFEQRLRRFDGEYRWFDTRGDAVRDHTGRITNWYVLLTDIEDRKQALARLEQMQSDFAHMNRVSMMGELAASLSHEITQPIASARNNARAAQNFMDRQPPDLSEVREALSCVVGDTDRAGDIVDRIREHIKNTPPRKEHFDVNEAISEVLLLARSAITENEVSVRTRFAEGPLAAHGDRVQVQQVVLNLVLNAVEAMASVEVQARLLLISTEQNRADEVLVAIRDSGPGIEPDHLERVFEAFYTTKSNGVGMGLSICRSIISAQGGRLWAETKKPRGAIFMFTLPGAGGSS